MEKAMGDMITISRTEYDRLRAAEEDLTDLRVHDRAMAGLASGADEAVPGAFAKRLIAGESPLRVWREFRQFSQSELARRAGVNRVQINDIESGAKTGSVATLRKLADQLGVTLDDLAC